MKKSYFLIAAALTSLIEILNAQSPDWLWAKAIGGTSDDRCYSIAIDPTNGDVYTTGSFWGTADFDPGAGVFNLTSISQDDIFISKLDSSGNFVWAKAINGMGSNIGRSIAVDPAGSGDVYTTGEFGGTVDFDPGPGVFNLTAPGATLEAFISRWNASGNFVWAKQMGGTDNEGGFSIAIDPSGSGDVYTTGMFWGTADFDPGAGVYNLTSVAYGDIFISKLDSSGNFKWAKAMGGIVGEYGHSLALDPSGSGDVYTTGSFGVTVDFDPGAGVFNLTSAGGDDIFISKLDSSGNFVWTKSIGGVAGNDYGNSIAIDLAGSGDVYTTGIFVGTVDFDPGVGVFNLNSTGQDDIFISKLDSSGNFVWAKAIGGTSFDVGESIAIDPSGSGDVYITGHFYGTVDFDPDSGVYNLTGSGAFISKLNSSGNFVWAKGVNGSSGKSMALDNMGKMYVAGFFWDSIANFDSTIIINAGTWDIFVAKLDTMTTVTGNNEIENFSKGIFVFPNPTSNHFTIALGSNNKNILVVITDVTGKIIYTATTIETRNIKVDTKGFAEGIYIVRIQSADFTETRKLMVVK